MKKFSSPAVTRVLRWLDENILVVLSSFLLAFIPLYPKIPLWSPIEQYIVRVRLEDIFILITAITWGIQVIRKKVRWHSSMFWLIAAYAVVGALSTLSAIYITKTIPMAPLHLGKSFLHYFRYLEYFSLFFILYSSMKSRKDVIRALFIFALTVLLVAVYGYGQRYFYWPVYSTMNREFSKGIRLYLTEFARVQSTFAGHYDMAAYLVIALPLILTFAYRIGQKWASTSLHWIFWIGTWLLILSASRTPFGAYIAAVGLVLFITSLLQETWRKKITFLFTRGTVFALLMTVLLYYFGTDMFERLGHVVRSNRQMDAFVMAIDAQRKMILPDEVVANSPLSSKKLLAMLPKGKPPTQAISTDDFAATVAAAEEAMPVASKSDQPPTPMGEPIESRLPARPAGVYEDIPDIQKVATVSATGETIVKIIKTPPKWSQCALEKELSLCIRLEVLWPRALEGFYTNPALGSGYATLTKSTVDQFTEADSTDNNYLRTLGETGLLGFITFYGAIVIILGYAVWNIRSQDWLRSAISVGVFCGTVGLLINAIYIDVFAASKVALTYWSLAGIFLGFLALKEKANNEPVVIGIGPKENTKKVTPSRRKTTKRKK